MGAHPGDRFVEGGDARFDHRGEASDDGDVVFAGDRRRTGIGGQPLKAGNHLGAARGEQGAPFESVTM